MNTNGKCYSEGCAFADNAVHGNCPTVQLDSMFGDGEAKPCARNRAGVRRAVEGFEQTHLIFFWNANAFV